MPSTDKLLTKTEGSIAHLLLNNAARLNALDHEMLLDIERCFAEWERKSAITVVVLGPASDRAFCVGADIEVLSRMNEQSMQAWELLGNRVLDRIESSPLISVASIPGYALGGGLTLAAACDFRICAADAILGQPEIGLGWIPGWGGVARLSRLIGIGRAKELCMTGRRITAQEGELAGLVNRVVDADQLSVKSAEFASELASQDRAALRGIKVLAESQVSGVAAHSFDGLLNASLLHNERAQAAVAKFLARKKT
jgi:enoyl-CoA hydratase